MSRLQDLKHEFRRLKDEFNRVHVKGLAALAAADFDVLSRMLTIERVIIQKQKQLLKEALAVSKRGIAGAGRCANVTARPSRYRREGAGRRQSGRY